MTQFRFQTTEHDVDSNGKRRTTNYEPIYFDSYVEAVEYFAKVVASEVRDAKTLDEVTIRSLHDVETFESEVAVGRFRRNNERRDRIVVRVTCVR